MHTSPGPGPRARAVARGSVASGWVPMFQCSNVPIGKSKCNIFVIAARPPLDTTFTTTGCGQSVRQPSCDYNGQMRVNTQRGQAEPESAAAEPGSHVTPEPRPEVYSEDQPPP